MNPHASEGTIYNTGQPANHPIVWMEYESGRGLALNGRGLTFNMSGLAREEWAHIPLHHGCVGGLI